MTSQEIKVLDSLIKSWNEFLMLPVEHLDDTREFRSGIHRLQEKIMSRPTRREINRSK